MNIVDMLLRLLGGGVSKQLAGMTGIAEDKIEAAIKAALPALLAALTGAASTKEGAQKLAAEVEGADDGILGNLGSALGGQAAALGEQGSTALGSLFSEGTLGNLGSVLGKFTGLGSGSTGKLLGMLAPVVLGFLKRETKSTGFDPASLTKVLEGQKSNIARALPSGLGGMLSGIPGLGNLASMAQGARDTVESAANRAAATAKSATPAGAGAAKWVVPLLIAVGLGLLVWNFWPKPEEPKAGANRASLTDLGSASVTAAKVTEEVARQVTTATTSANDIFADATEALSNVTDAESARKAAPKLPELTARLGQLKVLADAIPDAQRKPILETITKLRGTLLTQIDKVMEIPGVSSILGPHIENLKAALEAFDV
jgi:hypothetical protein